VIALALMCELPIDLTERILSQERPEQISVIARAFGPAWDTVKAMRTLQAGADGGAISNLEQCWAAYFKLAPETAKKTLNFYRMREQATATRLTAGAAGRDARTVRRRPHRSNALRDTGDEILPARQSGDYLIKKFSFLSFVPFISSRIQTGVAPRPDHLRLGSFLLRYFGATFRPLRDVPRLVLADLPLDLSPDSLASWPSSSTAFRLRTTPISSRSLSNASTDIEARLCWAIVGS
jgi:hypothetical protein